MNCDISAKLQVSGIFLETV